MNKNSKATAPKTFAARMKDFIKKEPDPVLQQRFAEALAQEQMAKAKELGLDTKDNQSGMAPDQHGWNGPFPNIYNDWNGNVLGGYSAQNPMGVLQKEMFPGFSQNKQPFFNNNLLGVGSNQFGANFGTRQQSMIPSFTPQSMSGYKLQVGANKGGKVESIPMGGDMQNPWHDDITNDDFFDMNKSYKIDGNNLENPTSFDMNADYDVRLASKKYNQKNINNIRKDARQVIRERRDDAMWARKSERIDRRLARQDKRQIRRDDAAAAGKMTAGQAIASGLIQIAPTVISGTLSAIGNKKLEDRSRKFADTMRNEYAKIKINPVKQAANYINLSNERNQAQAVSDNTKRINAYNLKNSATGRGAYNANVAGIDVASDRALGDIQGRSFMNEAVYNRGEDSRVGSDYARSLERSREFNAAAQGRGLDAYSEWNQQANAYRQGIIQSLQGMGGDINQIMAQNQMIASMGDRYGIEQTGPWWNPYRQTQLTYRGKRG